MKKMSSGEIRQMFLDFFKEQGPCSRTECITYSR